MKKILKHKLEIKIGGLIILAILCATSFKNKQIVLRSPILIETISPVSDNWAEDKLREMILESIKESDLAQPEAQGVTINTELVSSHSKKHPGVYAKIVEFFGKDSRVVGELLARESSMNLLAVNSTSGACGLFQAWPCSKLPCNLEDIDCQMNWGKEYIEDRYGSPANALLFQREMGWY